MITQQSNSRLRIAYLTELDARDKRSWSSGLYYMGQALQQHCGDVTYLGPIRSSKPAFLSRVRAKSVLMLHRKRYLDWLSIATAKRCGLEATQKLAGQAFDVIVSAISVPTTAYVETNIPIVQIGDCTWVQLLDYYPYYTNLSSRSICEMHTIEQQAFKKARAVIMSSEWAARSAIQDFHVDPEHVYIVSLGANFDTTPAREIVDAKKPSRIYRLLFIGTEWQRKGGNIAYEALLKLEAMGIEAELIVCGCVPPTGVAHPCMTIIPFLDKNDPDQQKQLEQLFITADLLVLPTRADCTPFVFNEANAFGLPVIATNTGGITDVVRDGENGYVLPFEARGEAYAQVIADLYHDESRYLRLVQSSRAAFEERLNWDAWGRHVHDILTKECPRGELAVTAPYSEIR